MSSEKRLIDANALAEKLETLKVRYKSLGRDAVAEDYNFVQTVLLTAPTVDAVEVVHGRLIETGWDEEYTAYGNCSICKADNRMSNNYCGNCGAKMDGEK